MKKKKRLNVKRIILSLLIIIIGIYFCTKNILATNKYNNTTFSNNTNNISKYPIIKQDFNEKYSGIGQSKVKNHDGYFTTFTTEKINEKIYKEYKQNGNYSWSNNKYWDDTMANSGCGITAMSIILSGYNKIYTPEDLRKMYYPVLDGSKISNELYKTFGISNSDFLYDSVHLSNEYIEKHLKTNRPILICVWNKPTENRWTTASHYMVLLATDSNGLVYVSNPNGLENDSKSSGWYDINEVTPYIAKALFIESYK